MISLALSNGNRLSVGEILNKGLCELNRHCKEPDQALIYKTQNIFEALEIPVLPADAQDV